MVRPSSMRSAIALVVAVLLMAAYSSGLQAAPAHAAIVSKTKQNQVKKQVHVIHIDQFLFQPSVLTVHAGDSVEWKNMGTVPHTATSNDGKTFDSRSIAPARFWSFKPAKKGTFHYVCTLHPNMKGTLIVK